MTVGLTVRLWQEEGGGKTDAVRLWWRGCGGEVVTRLWWGGCGGEAAVRLWGRGGGGVPAWGPLVRLKRDSFPGASLVPVAPL